MAARTTMPERMAHLETLIEDPELGLIAHVKTIDGKVDSGLATVNKKLDLLLQERAVRRPLLAAAKTFGAAALGAIAWSLVNALHLFNGLATVTATSPRLGK